MALLDATTGLPQMAGGPKLLGVSMKQVSLITVRLRPSKKSGCQELVCPLSRCPFHANMFLVGQLTFQNSAVTLMAHYSRVMPPTGDHRYFASTAVLLTELVKITISLSFAIYEASRTLAPSTPATVLFQQIYNAVFKGDGWKLAIPALLYTLQNNLQYVAVENLDPVHYQVILQLKVRSLIGNGFQRCDN